MGTVLTARIAVNNFSYWALNDQENKERRVELRQKIIEAYLSGQDSKPVKALSSMNELKDVLTGMAERRKLPGRPWKS